MQQKKGIGFLSKANTFFLLAALFFLIPVFTIFFLSIKASDNIWPHLLETVFPLYLKNSLLLMGGVAFFSFIFGVSSAWLITNFDFPSKKILVWATLLPFACPAYIIFYVYTDLLEYSGPVQGFLREIFYWQNQSDYWFPEIRSLSGGIILFSLVLYPYVYLLARKAFLEQSQSILESAEMLGLNRWQTFFRISLPLARPAIAVGVILVVMETLNDFGAVEFFSISTLSLGVYNVWINMSNLGGASQIAMFTLFIVFFLIFLERIQRKRQKQMQNENSHKITHRLKGGRMLIVMAYIWGLISLGFFIPLIVLLRYAIINYTDLSFSTLFNLVQNSFLLATLASGFTILASLIIVYYMRFYQTKIVKIFSKFFYLNYAIPGIIMAIGMMIPFNFFFGETVDFLEKYLFFNPQLFVYFSLVILLLAYVTRFISIPIGAIDSTFKKTTTNLDASASLLGLTNFKIFTKLHFPLIRNATLTAALIIFVDTMKELPMTLILRPFNFDTLATNVYSFANDELIEKASFPALFIVIIGILPTILLSKNIND